MEKDGLPEDEIGEDGKEIKVNYLIRYAPHASAEDFEGTQTAI